MKISMPEIKTPGACLEELRKRAPKYIWLTFAAAVVLGIATHLYMLVNKLPNHDDIGHLFSFDYGTASGRWLLPLVARMDGAFSIPWFIGLISVLCLAGTACFTVSLLRIRSVPGCAIAAAIIVSFPTVTATFTFMFTATPYFFSLMLAAFGAYAAVRFRPIWGFVLGAAAITLSMGIYQSYLGVAAVLMVGALLFETLDGKDSFGALFLKGVRMAGALVCSVAAYMVIVRITTRNIALVDYMGISDMGKISLQELPWQLVKCFGSYYKFFISDAYGYHFGFLKFAFAATALCCIVLGVLLLRERRLGRSRTVLALALAAVYPLAANLIYLMVPNGGIHTLMIYGLSYILIAPVALVDYTEINWQKLSRRAVQAIAGWVVLLSMTAAAYSYAVTANTAYLKIDLSLRQATAYSTRLLERIESCEGYHRDLPVMLLGSGIVDDGLWPTPQLNSVEMVGVFSLAHFRTSYSYNYFLRYYLGYTGEIYLDSSDGAPSFSEVDEVRAMPTYPEQGSIRVINGWVVVKLNETAG